MKKFLSLIMVVSVLLSATAITSFAALKPGKTEEKFVSTVDKANDKIEKEISKAQSKANDKNDDKVIEKLVEKTDKISGQTSAKAEKDGAVVECEYVAVEVNGQIVMVDPIRVISFPR